MIDRNNRQTAIRVSSGIDPVDGTESKVVLYGILARSFRIDDLKGLQLPIVDDFNALQAAAGMLLQRIATKSYDSLDKDDGQVVEDLFLERDHRARDMHEVLGGLTVYGHRRVTLGALTAAHRETITLRTIAREIYDGSTVTERGLYLSSRVPLKLALLHLYDLNDESNYHEEWQTPQLDVGDVYKKGAVKLDHDEGLSLLVRPEIDAPYARRSHGPQIGCPVSMVQGYVREIHNLMVDAALSSGLIAVP